MKNNFVLLFAMIFTGCVFNIDTPPVATEEDGGYEELDGGEDTTPVEDAGDEPTPLPEDSSVPGNPVTDAGTDAKVPTPVVDAGTPVVDSGTVETYVHCANEFSTCAFTGTKTVRFGKAPDLYTYTTHTNGVLCSFQVLGDPAPGQTKTCSILTGQVAPVDAGAQQPPVVDAGTPPAPDKDSGVKPPPTDANRPAESKGVGFFVVGNKMFDGNGNEFTMRGTNKTHIDSWSQSLGQMASNTTRFINYFYQDPTRVLRDMASPNIGGSTVNGKDVMIPGLWDSPGGQLTCQSGLGAFEAGVAVWVRDAKQYQTMERYIIVNIANEWGNDSTAWKNAYIAAIPKIRAAGWHGAIQVDAPGCGQNAGAVIQWGRDIFNADPEKNITFDIHVYGLFYDSQGGIVKQWNEQLDLVPTFDKLASTGLHIVIGEFGPGRNIGPSPTMITPQRIVALAEERGFGWLTWSWDDWSGGNETASENSFGHIKQGNTYNSDADLTQWGREAKALWLQYNSKPATVFQ